MTVPLSNEQREELRRQMRSLIRKAISDAYYESRNDGETMEHAANVAASAVWTVLEGFGLDALDAGPRSEIEVELLREAMQGAREGQSWTPSAADIAVEYNRLAALRATEEIP